MTKKKNLTFDKLFEYITFSKNVGKQIALDIFDFVTEEHGYFKDNWYPGKTGENQEQQAIYDQYYKLLFDKNGNPRTFIEKFLPTYLTLNNFHWGADLITLYHFLHIGSITKGNYSIMQVWQK